jgi:predicted MFS family arabinose efflux permease
MTALVSSNRRGSLMSLTMAAGQAGFALGSAGAGLSYTRLGFLGNAIFATMGALVTAGLLLSGVPEPTGDAL